MKDLHMYNVIDITLNGEHILTFRDMKDGGRCRQIWKYDNKFFQINFGVKPYDVAEYFEIDPEIVRQVSYILGDKQISFEF